MAGAMQATFSRRDIVSRNVRWHSPAAEFTHGASSGTLNSTNSTQLNSWRPLASYAFIKIKLASHHLLLYVVYMCQK